MVDVHQQPAAKLAALDPLQRTRDRATTSTTMATLSLTTLTKPQELKEYTVSLASQSISWLRDYVTAIKHGAPPVHFSLTQRTGLASWAQQRPPGCLGRLALCASAQGPAAAQGAWEGAERAVSQ